MNVQLLRLSTKKSLPLPKKIGRGDSLVSPGMVWYAGKQEKPFWFSSLDQIVHFGPIIFCRTFKNYFGQCGLKKKRKVTIIVAFHFMKRRLKTFQFFPRRQSSKSGNNSKLFRKKIVKIHCELIQKKFCFESFKVYVQNSSNEPHSEFL